LKDNIIGSFLSLPCPPSSLPIKEDGCLPEEIPIAGDHLFRFQVDDNWFAVAQRQEVRTLWGQQTFKIEVLELSPVAEFEKISNSKPLEIEGWMQQMAHVIIPFIHDHSLTILLMALITTSFAIVGYKVIWETDGVTNKVTIESQSQ
jgi:hypothetical protein